MAAAGFGANLSVASVATSPTAVVMATAPSSAESRDPIKREEAQSDVNHSNPKKPIDQHRVRSIELDPVGFPWSFYLVLPSFTLFYLVLPNFTLFYLILPSFT